MTGCPEEAHLQAEKTARYILIGLLVLLGGWMLRHFLAALCWAVILAIATAPLYDRWLADSRQAPAHLGVADVHFPARHRSAGAHRVRRVHRRARRLLRHPYVRRLGEERCPEIPDWVRQLPWIGQWLSDQITSSLGDANAAAHVVSQARPTVVELTRAVGAQVLRRLVTLVFTLLTLFFVYMNRDSPHG